MGIGQSLDEPTIWQSDYDELKRENAALQKELTKWKGNFTVKQGIVEELMKDVAELQSAREVIEKYQKLVARIDWLVQAHGNLRVVQEVKQAEAESGLFEGEES